MDKKKKLGNKGFSLVELIIVIAIMVILVGVLAPQYIKYLDKSKIAADTQLADNIRQVLTTTLLDPTITTRVPGRPTSLTTLLEKPASADETDYWQNVYEALGVDNLAGLRNALKYDNSSAVKIEFAVDSNGNVSVQISEGNYKKTSDTINHVITVPNNGTTTPPTSTSP